MELFQYPKPPERPRLRYGALELTSRFLLSPLAGYTNLPFRRVVREIGGLGLATTDLVNARGLLAGSPRSMELIATCPEDKPLAVQIFGSEPSVMAEAAVFLEARGVHSVDINMGCPVDHVVKGGAGAGLMCRTNETLGLVERVVNAVRIPVTVKMRLGWDRDQITAPDFARAFEDLGVAAVAIHGRTRAQGFSGAVDRQGIRAVVEAVRSMPIIGNGDVRSIPDAARMLDETGCQGVSIGRGALANPWIFSQLVAWEQTGAYPPTGNFEDRLQLLLKQFQHLVEQLGIEQAIRFFRKMGHWYLRSMRVSARLRNEFQLAKTPVEFDNIIRVIAERGPIVGTKHEPLPEFQIPVPSGPVERW